MIMSWSDSTLTLRVSLGGTQQLQTFRLLVSSSYNQIPKTVYVCEFGFECSVHCNPVIAAILTYHIMELFNYLAELQMYFKGWNKILFLCSNTNKVFFWGQSEKSQV